MKRPIQKLKFKRIRPKKEVEVIHTIPRYCNQCGAGVDEDVVAAIDAAVAEATLVEGPTLYHCEECIAAHYRQIARLRSLRLGNSDQFGTA